MSTISLQIAIAATAALTAGRPSGVPAPVRTRLESPGPDQLPALTVYRLEEAVKPMHDDKEGMASRGAVVRRALDLKVEAVVKAAPDGPPADDAADPLLAWTTKAIAAAGKLGGLVNQAGDEIGTKFEYEQGTFSFCRATMTVRFFYQSGSGNAEALT